MKVTLHLEGSKLEILNQCLEFMNMLNGKAPKDASSAAAPATTENAEEPKKRGRKSAAAKDDDSEASSDDSEDDDLGFDDEEEEEKEITSSDIAQAFRAYTAKAEGNRDKAKKLLAKLGVKAVRDVPKEKYEAVMKALSK